MTLFLAVYFLVYGGVHAYLYFKLADAFPLPAAGRWALAAFLVLMVLLPVAVHVLERAGQEKAACLAAWTGYLWMGALFFAFCLLLVFDA
jgi:hypothetical protein